MEDLGLEMGIELGIGIWNMVLGIGFANGFGKWEFGLGIGDRDCKLGFVIGD